jgi:hypothetical protein
MCEEEPLPIATSCKGVYCKNLVTQSTRKIFDFDVLPIIFDVKNLHFEAMQDDFEFIRLNGGIEPTPNYNIINIDGCNFYKSGSLKRLVYIDGENFNANGFNVLSNSPKINVSLNNFDIYDSLSISKDVECNTDISKDFITINYNLNNTTNKYLYSKVVNKNTNEMANVSRIEQGTSDTGVRFLNKGELICDFQTSEQVVKISSKTFLETLADGKSRFANGSLYKLYFYRRDVNSLDEVIFNYRCASSQTLTVYKYFRNGNVLENMNDAFSLSLDVNGDLLVKCRKLTGNNIFSIQKY